MKNKIHLIGGTLHTICGRDLESVYFVLDMKDDNKNYCKLCRKNAKEFQKINATNNKKKNK